MGNFTKSKPGNKRKTLANGRSAEAPEHWTKLLRSTGETLAWRALPLAAQAAYPWVKFEWKGPKANNNGKIRLSVRQLADRMGCSINTAAKALQELQAKGFLVVTEQAVLGVDGEAKGPSFEITEVALPTSAKGEYGRQLYKQWAGEDFPVMKARANNPYGNNGRGGTKSHLKNDDSAVIKFETKTRGAS